MRRTALACIGLLVLASGVWMGTRAAGEWSRLRGIDAEMVEEKTALAAAREKRRELREQMDEAKKEIREIPDSLKASRTGIAMQKSFDFAKTEGIIEDERARAQSRLRYLEAERERAAGSISRWAVALAAVEAFLIGGAVVVHRWGRRGK